MILQILSLIIDHSYHAKPVYAIAPAIAAALISAIPALVQAGKGISQGSQARKLAREWNPDYQIPTSITDNVSTAQGAYNAASAYGLPGQGRIQNQIGQNTASAMQAIQQSQQSPAAMLAGLSSVNQNANNAMADLGVNAAQFRQQNMMNTMNSLMSARQALAQFQDRQFEINKLKPFEAQMAASGALRAGGMQNIYGGLSSLASTGANAYLRSNTGVQGTQGQRVYNPNNYLYPMGTSTDYIPPVQDPNQPLNG